MSPQRARMIEDMILAGLAGGTRKLYVQAVRRLAAQNPELLVKVHAFRCGSERAHKLPRGGENVVRMDACPICLSDLARTGDALKRANRSRWFSPDRRAVTSR